ncbi:unnamed protein product [Anisakis simplex]|uniref:Secreted protein n=1 Tax=Anisakis simplex TaxID=6269 RepID=A0A0M3IYY0_ANISI|nr:unnamed protein product [Anisakis simplex]
MGLSFRFWSHLKLRWGLAFGLVSSEAQDGVYASVLVSSEAQMGLSFRFWFHLKLKIGLTRRFWSHLKLRWDLGVGFGLI